MAELTSYNLSVIEPDGNNQVRLQWRLNVEPIGPARRAPRITQVWTPEPLPGDEVLRRHLESASVNLQDPSGRAWNLTMELLTDEGLDRLVSTNFESLSQLADSLLLVEDIEEIMPLALDYLRSYRGPVDRLHRWTLFACVNLSWVPVMEWRSEVNGLFGPQQCIQAISGDWASSVRDGDRVLRGLLHSVGAGRSGGSSCRLVVRHGETIDSLNSLTFEFDDISTLRSQMTAALSVVQPILPAVTAWLCDPNVLVPELTSYQVNIGTRVYESAHYMPPAMDAALADVLDRNLPDSASRPMSLDMTVRGSRYTFEFTSRAELSLLLSEALDLRLDEVVVAIPRTLSVVCGTGMNWEQARLGSVHIEITHEVDAGDGIHGQRCLYTWDSTNDVSFAVQQILVAVGAVGIAAAGELPATGLQALVRIRINGLGDQSGEFFLEAASLEELRELIHDEGLAMVMWNAMLELMHFLHGDRISDPPAGLVENMRAMVNTLRNNLGAAIAEEISIESGPPRSGTSAVRDFIEETHRRAVAAMAVPPDALSSNGAQSEIQAMSRKQFISANITVEGCESCWAQNTYRDKPLDEVISHQLELVKRIRANHPGGLMLIKARFSDTGPERRLELEPHWHRNAEDADLAWKWRDALKSATGFAELAEELGGLCGEVSDEPVPEREETGSYVHLKVATPRGDGYVTAYIVAQGKITHEASFAFCSPASQFERERGREIARKRYADGQKVLLSSGGTRSRHDMVEEWIESLREGGTSLCQIPGEHTVSLPRWLFKPPVVVSRKMREILGCLLAAAGRFEESTHEAALELKNFARMIQELGPLEPYESDWAPHISAVSDDELNVGTEAAADEFAGELSEEEAFNEIFDELIEEECSS